MVMVGFLENDVEERNNFLLTCAASDGDFRAVESLIWIGADVNHMAGYSLQQACSQGHTLVAKILIEHGADLNVEGSAALIRASENVHKCDTLSQRHVIRMLINNGIKINRDVVDSLVEHGHLFAIKLILKNGTTKEVRGLITRALRLGTVETDKDLIDAILLKEIHDT